MALVQSGLTRWDNRMIFTRKEPNKSTRGPGSFIFCLTFCFVDNGKIAEVTSLKSAICF